MKRRCRPTLVLAAACGFVAVHGIVSPGHVHLRRGALPADVRGETPRAVQTVIEHLAERASKLEAADRATASSVELGLASLEGNLASEASRDAALEDEIWAERGKLCALVGYESRPHSECDDFMHTACSLSQEPAFEGRSSEVVAVVLCQQFFQAEARAASAGAPAPAPMDADAAAAPPLGMAPPAPAPAPAGEHSDLRADDDEPSGLALEPQVHRNLGSASEWGPSPWYPSKEEGPLPEQGVSGVLVEHDDDETATGDWRREFGPAAKHRTVEEICRDHADNVWCKGHMYKPPTPQPTLLKTKDSTWCIWPFCSKSAAGQDASKDGLWDWISLALIAIGVVVIIGVVVLAHRNAQTP